MSATPPPSEGNAPKQRVPKPKWLRVKLPTGEAYREVRNIVSEHKLHTICESGHCPNMGECWGEGTATFMILGNICTRSCGFCNVVTGKPLEVDAFEPGRVAQSVKLMGVKHAVITSVDRDDLPDGGAEIWAQTVRAIRHQSPGTTLETLIPDFAGKWDNLQKIIQVAPKWCHTTLRRFVASPRRYGFRPNTTAAWRCSSDSGTRGFAPRAASCWAWARRTTKWWKPWKTFVRWGAKW